MVDEATRAEFIENNEDDRDIVSDKVEAPLFRNAVILGVEASSGFEVKLSERILVLNGAVASLETCSEGLGSVGVILLFNENEVVSAECLIVLLSVEAFALKTAEPGVDIAELWYSNGEVTSVERRDSLLSVETLVAMLTELELGNVADGLTLLLYRNDERIPVDR